MPLIYAKQSRQLITAVSLSLSLTYTLCYMCTLHTQSSTYHSPDENNLGGRLFASKQRQQPLSSISPQVVRTMHK